MSRVVSVGTAKIPYVFDQEEIKVYVNSLYSDNNNLIDKMIGVFDNSGIKNRHFIHPPEWFDVDRGFMDRSESFLENSVHLSTLAIADCLCNYPIESCDIDHIIFVSSTGVATPTIDAYLINKLPLKNDIKRTPIWGLGCVGGATGLSRALDYTTAYPNSATLVVCVELCSLAFQKQDQTKSNIVSLALFSDGAAACLVAGRDHPLYDSGSLNLLSSHTNTFEDSLDVMGWEIVESGFKAIFSKNIPNIVREKVSPGIREILDISGVKIEELKHFILHPGGPKVLKAFEESFDKEEGSFKDSRRVLKEHGNMSSPTVLYVLKEFMSKSSYSVGEYGIISALGPGFTSELLIFKT